MYPILFKIGPLTIHTYGVLLALAFLAAIYMAAREGARLGLPAESFLDLGFYIILADLVGSRLLFVILEPRTFFKPSSPDLRHMERRPGFSGRVVSGPAGGLSIHPLP